MLHLQLKDIQTVCPTALPSVFQTLPQLFKPSFNHPNNPQVFSTISLPGYFKFTLRQTIFFSKLLPHWTTTLGYVQPHNCRLSQVQLLESSCFWHMMQILCFPAAHNMDVGCRNETKSDQDAHYQPNAPTHVKAMLSQFSIQCYSNVTEVQSAYKS